MTITKKRIAQAVKEASTRGKPFVVFVENMDGDVYPSVDATIYAIGVALRNGAKEVRIKEWK
jgi:hypothetical protein